MGVRLSDLGNEQWSLSDGRSLTRFTDGVVRSPLCSSNNIHCSPYAPLRDQAGLMSWEMDALTWSMCGSAPLYSSAVPLLLACSFSRPAHSMIKLSLKASKDLLKAWHADKTSATEGAVSCGQDR